MTESAPLPVAGLRTPLLGTEALRNHLGVLLARPPSSLLIVSAYVTKIGVEWLRNQTSGIRIDCDIVARWSPSDLLSGASDIEGCIIALEQGWRFNVLPDLHAKVTLIDESDIVVGSANLTGAGMSLVPAANREFGIAAKATPQDVLACRALLADAVPMTRELLEKISEWVAVNKARLATTASSFPSDIQDHLIAAPTRLFTAELPWLPASDLIDLLSGSRPFASNFVMLQHDLALLGLKPLYGSREAAISAISFAIERSRFWRWLVGSVRAQPNGEIWYGGVTSILHDALCDDPRPYRQDVKTLVSNLYSYADMCGCGLTTSRPNRSQRLAVDPVYCTERRRQT